MYALLLIPAADTSDVGQVCDAMQTSSASAIQGNEGRWRLKTVQHDWSAMTAANASTLMFSPFATLLPMPLPPLSLPHTPSLPPPPQLGTAV